MLRPRDECLTPFPAATTFREVLRIVTKLLSHLETRGRGTETGRYRIPAGRCWALSGREEVMPDEPKPGADRSYQMGNIGAGARVAQGENISWVEGVASLPDGESLTRQFDALLKRITADGSLDEDTRALAQDKTKAIAEGIAGVQESPGMLRRALLDAKSWFGTSASWVGSALGEILKSEAAQKTLRTVTETATKAAIASFVS